MGSNIVSPRSSLISFLHGIVFAHAWMHQTNHSKKIPAFIGVVTLADGQLMKSIWSAEADRHLIFALGSSHTAPARWIHLCYIHDDTVWYLICCCSELVWPNFKILWGTDGLQPGSLDHNVTRRLNTANLWSNVQNHKRKQPSSSKNGQPPSVSHTRKPLSTVS